MGIYVAKECLNEREKIKKTFCNAGVHEQGYEFITTQRKREASVK